METSSMNNNLPEHLENMLGKPKAAVSMLSLGSSKSKSKKKCTPANIKKFMKARVQILNWIKDYNSEWAINDLIAGITLGLTIIPESIACALLAGLPPHYGLCSCFIGCFLYLIFGSIPKVIMGPTSLVALVSVKFTVGKPLEFAVLLTFFSGIVEVIMGCLGMGFIFDFLSMPIIKGFSSATAVLVIESQIKVLLGIKYLVAGLIASVTTLAGRLDECNFGDLVMGLGAITFLITLAQLEAFSSKWNLNKSLRNTIRYLSYSRNTLIVLFTALISYVWLTQSPTVPYALSANALSGLPNFTWPSMTVETPEHTYGFFEILSSMSVGIVVIPIVGMLTNISIGRLNPQGSVNSNQELITVGICNIFSSCVQSMPTSGAFSRYGISNSCGLKTSMANVYTGSIVILALCFLSPYFNYIPEATLAAILICSIYTLFDFKLPVRLWRECKRDFFTWLLCFGVSLACGVEVGLIVSVIVTLLYLLLLWARPEVIIKLKEFDGIEYVRVTPGNGIYFPAINHLREKVLKACSQVDFKVPVVMDCHKINGLDYTAAQGISKLSIDLQRQSLEYCGVAQMLILSRMNANQRKLIDLTDNLMFCDDDDKIHSMFLKESQRNELV